MSNPHKDRLERIMRNTTWGTSFPDIQAMADAILADSWTPDEPTVIEEIADLEALPVGTILRSTVDGVSYIRMVPTFFGWKASDQVGVARLPSEVIAERGPMQLLYLSTPPS